jgi:hypothetical protein
MVNYMFLESAFLQTAGKDYKPSRRRGFKCLRSARALSEQGLNTIFSLPAQQNGYIHRI